MVWANCGVSVIGGMICGTEVGERYGRVLLFGRPLKKWICKSIRYEKIQYRVQKCKQNEINGTFPKNGNNSMMLAKFTLVWPRCSSANGLACDWSVCGTKLTWR